MKWKLPKCNIATPLSIEPKTELRHQIEAQLFPRGFITDLVNGEPIHFHLASKFTTLPRRVYGFDLFRRQQAHVTPTYQHEIWRNLLDADKLHFFNESIANDLFTHEVRVWKGYEIVKFLKNRARNYDEVFNPYIFLDLYPWEILYEKHKYGSIKEGFEIDYYDCLAPAKTSVLQHNEQSIRSRYRQLGNDHYTTDLLELVSRLEFTGHARFWKQQFAYYDPQMTIKEFTLQQAQKWSSLSPAEKDRYKTLSGINPRSRLYKDSTVDKKVGRALQFIYNVVGTDSTPLDFNWRQYRREKVGNWIYQHGYYVDKYVYSVRLAKVAKLVADVNDLLVSLENL